MCRLHFATIILGFLVLRLDEAYVSSGNAVPHSSMIEHVTDVSTFKLLNISHNCKSIG